MESIMAKALEYTLKYWLKSFSRDQFKLQGRTAQLSNLELDGEALHSSLGFPPMLSVTTAKVGKLEIMLPSVSNVQTEPIIFQVDRLNLALEENSDFQPSENPTSNTTSSSSSKGSGYGFSDKIADGMTIQIRTVNLLIETRGSACCQGEPTRAPPVASITMHNFVLYTTNESWEVVNLKEAREFSSNKKYIYVFKKLEWESMSFDLLPHPDMFTDPTLGRSQEGSNPRDEDGEKRVLFGAERLIEGISGEAFITVQRTELNSPFALEVQFHVTEAVCPALSEPGLRAFLRFKTGLHVCLSRGNVDLKAKKRSTEAARNSIVSIVVDHIFLCIKDSDFQLELLMQSLHFSRASQSEGDSHSSLTKIIVGGVFLRDTISFPPCTLVQPSTQSVIGDAFQVPTFARSFCPSIYPLGEQQWQSIVGTPLICLHSVQIMPALPPSFACQTVIDCQPLMIHLQEETCLKISSFLADSIVVNHGDILPDFSVKSFNFTLKGLDLTVPLDKICLDISKTNINNTVNTSFAGARLRIENLFFLDSPSLILKILNLEKDPACFCLWEGQPIDASQKKWTAGAFQVTLSLEVCTDKPPHQSSLGWTSGLWRCVDLKDARIEVAMVTADGNPLLKVPPPGGIVRLGIACEQYLSNTSLEQLYFVLSVYDYFRSVSEKIAIAGKKGQLKDVRNKYLSGNLMEKIPSDTSVSLTIKNLQLQFLESSSVNSKGMPLVQFVGDDFFVSATHRTLGGAIAVSSTLNWERVQIDCRDSEEHFTCENDSPCSTSENLPSISDHEHLKLRPVFWVHNKKRLLNGNAHSYPFLDIHMEQVIPFCVVDTEVHTLNLSASISGVRLGGGMNYSEALLHRFGVLGPDGGPGNGLSKGWENLQTGPLAKLFKTTSPIDDNLENVETTTEGKGTSFSHLKKPDTVDITIQLRDWLFALEGEHDMAERWWFSTYDANREERCWHTTFHILRLNAKSCPKRALERKTQSHRIQLYPVDVVTVGVQGLKIMKPQAQKDIPSSVITENGVKQFTEEVEGIDLEVGMILREDNEDDEIFNWEMENLKFYIRQTNEAIVTKEDVQNLTFLCKSEIDSVGRIISGVLRIFKLESSVGQYVIDRLGNLGSKDIVKNFCPEKPSIDGSVSSQQNLTKESPRKTMEQTLTSLEEAVAGSQTKISDLISDIGTSESSFQHLTVIKELSQKIESMQGLVVQLKNQL
ncbi:Vacuolar protein sorting-associated protein 13 [Vigna unguiculata]|uniref:Vacuolar protein sorting-associated protein 13 n=1 Tax=Vigna unguiculata TaxID=3917 RepID=A0A4D6LFB7_VIGUN|nr:Vacuolar protein sorting-associated protein 13 [Vigna unguiculata]